MKRPAAPKTFKDWLGLESQFNPLSVYWLGPIVTAILGLLVLFLLLPLVVLLLSDFFQAISLSGQYAEDKDGASIRNIGLVLVALFGSPFLVWRTIVAARQARISEDSLFNEKITSFANQLAARRQVTEVVEGTDTKTVLTEWEDDVVARAAAIDGLESLTSERPKVSPRIVHLLAGYVRGTFPAEDCIPTDGLISRVSPRMDLQKAISSIGRINREASKHDLGKWRIDLQFCDLSGVKLSDGFFRAADFSDSRFEGAILNNGNFEGCLFYRSLLNHASVHSANLTGAKLDHCNWSEQNIHSGFASSTIKGISFLNSDISGVDYLSSKATLSETFGNADTKLSGRMKSKMPSNDALLTAELVRDAYPKDEWTKKELETVQDVLKSGFGGWSPYPDGDVANFYIRKTLYQKLNLDFWPFNEE